MSIRNDTDLTLPVTGRDAANLHASIRTEPDSRLAKFLPFGRSRSSRGQRTDLLVDLAPGRSITQPIKLTMPETPGTVDYVVTLERKGCVLARTQQSITLVTGQDPLETGWGDSGEIRDYNTDHLHAFEVMTQWLDAYAKGEESVLLKLGGSFSPMTHVWPGRRFNMDIDAHGMFSHSLLRAPDVMNPDRLWALSAMACARPSAMVSRLPQGDYTVVAWSGTSPWDFPRSALSRSISVSWD